MSTVALPIPSSSSKPGFAWVLPVGSFALASTASVLCLVAAGPLHGVLFGACLVAVLLSPVLVAGETRWRMALLTTAGVLVGCALGPAVALLQGNLNGRLFSTLVAVVAPLVLALAGVTSLLVFFRVPAAVATALVTLVALAWLSWPIWLSPWLAGNESLVSQLSPAHPLLVIDAAIGIEQGTPWVEHRLMYAKLTVLGQHVFPRPPVGAGLGALIHGTIGVVCFAIVTGAQLWQNRRTARHDWDEFEAA